MTFFVPVIVAAAVVMIAALVGALMLLRARRQRHRVDQLVQDAVVEIAAAGSREAVARAVRRAVHGLRPAHPPAQVRVVPPGELESQTEHELVPITVAGTGGEPPIGALLVDPVTAGGAQTRGALQVISAQAALALRRIQLTEEVAVRGSAIWALVEQSTDVILVLDGEKRIRYASPSVRSVLGTGTADGLDLRELIDAGDRASAEHLLGEAADPASPPHEAAWTIQATDGRRVYVEATCRPLRSIAPYDGVVVTMRDVTTQRNLEDELSRRVFHDRLTGLPNRQLFSDRLREALTRGDAVTGVLMVDLDQFKTINEGYGHAAGDTVLETVGNRIHELVGPNGAAARLGDDEFAALLPDLAAPEQVAARLAETLAVPIAAGEVQITSTASIGVATANTARDARELLHQADLALGAAKAAGPGQWRRYDPTMTDAATDRVELRAELNRATGDGSLRIEYQPIVALDSGRTVGYEALVRWQHPTRGRLHPAEFVDLAEETGLIVPIGQWVLASAMRAATQWRASPPHEPPYVSVNVSGRQFQAGTFADTVTGLLETTGLPPERLMLEVTEKALLGDGDRAWADLQKLRTRGVRVAIDDFGTGYSGLSYLRQAPLDVVKLDRSFTGPLTSSTRQRDLVAGIVRLARSLHLTVVAEGIETRYQRDITALIGTEYGQGYLFGRPQLEPAGQPAAGRGR